MRLHRRFHFVLGRFQFLLKRIPLVVLGEFVDAVAAAEHVLAYAQRFREFDNVGADVFDLLAVFRFNRNKSVRDQAPEIERDLSAILVGHPDRAAHLANPIRLARFFQRREKFTRSWNCDRIVADRFGHLLGRKPSRFRTDHGTASQ